MFLKKKLASQSFQYLESSLFFKTDNLSFNRSFHNIIECSKSWPLFKKPSKVRKFVENKNDLIVKTALKTIDIEAESIRNLRNSINDTFLQCVHLIYESQGRVVVTGIGKSALIAQKTVATLNSTGTPALFMHAADAIHGDLGMIQVQDVVLCLSKSGETAEIKVLVPMLRHICNTFIAMVGNMDSYLAQQADFVLHTPVLQEADPNNLAPTASTAAQMAMGDALATALLAMRGFSSEDFAQFHPGGSLGKRLYLRVQDIYPQNPKPAVPEAANIRQTILEMTSKRLGCTAVLDASQQVCGIITDGDLRRMLERETDAGDLCASDIMSSSPKTIPPDTLAVKALELMRRHSITQLIVVDENGYQGIVHLHDLLREGLV